jgi:chromosome segregation ATPase
MAVETAASALGALETSHEEFEDFFGDVFDQLQSLSLELFARHKCLELGAQHQAEQEAAVTQREAHFQELLEQLRQLHEQARQSAGEQQQAWTDFRTSHEEEWTGHRSELHSLQETIEDRLEQLTAIASQLSAARAQAESAADPGRQQELERLLQDARQQRAAWEQERSGLEAELEVVRNRAAELSENLAEQRRQAAEHQAALAAELKRMRSLLEAISGRMQPGTPTTSGSVHTTAGDDAALDSVLAQFELLQRDIAERRTAKTKERTH